MPSNMNNMKEKLEEKNNRKKQSPTGALLQSFENTSKSQQENETDDKFQNLSRTKQKVEDTHTRKTFLVRDDLIDRLEKVASEKHHGFKTEFINTAIEYGLERMEEDIK